MGRVALSLAILVLAGGEASAQSAAARKAARELVDFLERRFAREVAEEGAEKLEGRFAKLIATYGDETAAAARKVGPRMALAAVEAHGTLGARVVAKWGDDGARLLATDGKRALGVLATLGEDGVDLMIRQHGKMAAARLPDLAEAIAASGRPRDVLSVLGRYGDRACNFIWKNKGVIFGATALAAFLANPQPYLDGLMSLPQEAAARIADRTNWTALFGIAAALIAAIAAIRMFLLRPARPVEKTAPAD